MDYKPTDMPSIMAAMREAEKEQQITHFRKLMEEYDAESTIEAPETPHDN